MRQLSQDARHLRNALGRFVTGVTVVTARRATGEPIGLTANSFSSVSLDPPLVLWNLNKRSQNRVHFSSASHFGINVLAGHQASVASRFATPQEDRFAHAAFRIGETGVPLLVGCIAWFECRNFQQHEAGDHVIFIGEVARFEYADGEPLLFHNGCYGLSVVRDSEASVPERR